MEIYVDTATATSEDYISLALLAKQRLNSDIWDANVLEPPKLIVPRESLVPCKLPEYEDSAPPVEEKPKPRRGRKPKGEQPTAAQLHEALKELDTDTRPQLPEPEAQASNPSENATDTPASEEAPEGPLDDRSHEDLVKAIREIMFQRGHVWMRNVLEKHKKEAKTMAEMSSATLASILADPDQFDEVA